MGKAMQIIRKVQELRAWTALQRLDRQTIAFIPTMGALHEGHISLVKAGKNQCSRTLASIFVNPKQFGPKEDFASYPRTETQDVEMLQAAGIDAVFLPAPQEIYPQGFSTEVSVKGISDDLEGIARPQFFYGVATVVAKMLLQALPDVGVFGEKDYQQLHIIRRMVNDLDIPVNIVGAPTVREKDGLAMASRNRYLSEADRAIAPLLYKTLVNVADALRQGKPAQAALFEAKDALVKGGFARVDYLELRDAESLSPVESAAKPARLLTASYIGNTRLIDNIAV